MSYNPNIPQPSDKLSQSQPSILTNFQKLNEIFEVDHLSYTASDVANRGKHMGVHMREQLSVPSTASQEVCVFSQRSSGNLSLYYREENNGPVHPLTSSSSTTGGGPQGGSGTMTIGNIRFCWGSAMIPANQTSVVITFPAPFTEIPQILLSSYSTYPGGLIAFRVYTGVLTFNEFECRKVTGKEYNGTVAYFAVGAS